MSNLLVYSVNKLIIDLAGSAELADALKDMTVGDELPFGSMSGVITAKDDRVLEAELKEVEYEGYAYSFSETEEAEDEMEEPAAEKAEVVAETEPKPAEPPKKQGRSLLVIVGPDGAQKTR